MFRNQPTALVFMMEMSYDFSRAVGTESSDMYRWVSPLEDLLSGMTCLIHVIWYR